MVRRPVTRRPSKKRKGWLIGANPLRKFTMAFARLSRGRARTRIFAGSCATFGENQRRDLRWNLARLRSPEKLFGTDARWRLHVAAKLFWNWKLCVRKVANA